MKVRELMPLGRKLRSRKTCFLLEGDLSNQLLNCSAPHFLTFRCTFFMPFPPGCWRLAANLQWIACSSDDFLHYLKIKFLSKYWLTILEFFSVLPRLAVHNCKQFHTNPIPATREQSVHFLNLPSGNTASVSEHWFCCRVWSYSPWEQLYEVSQVWTNAKG